MDIKTFIEKRKIDCLIHFTTTTNLLGIFELGELTSRSRLDDLRSIQGGDYFGDYIVPTDNIRADGLSNYINLSVSHTNWYLLNQFKKRQSDDWIEWCVLQICPTILEEKDVLFSVCNASSTAAKKFGITGGLSGLERLYCDQVNYKGRELNRIGLESKFPTDVQAEVLIKDTIPLEKVIGICFENNEALDLTKASLSVTGLINDEDDLSELFRVNAGLFAHR